MSMTKQQSLSWAERLKSRNVADHTDRAQLWGTCAIGEILEPPDPETMEQWMISEHPILHSMGFGFADAVLCNRKDLALDMYEQIHRYITKQVREDFKKFLEI